MVDNFNKTDIRRALLMLRSALPYERRVEASRALLLNMTDKLFPYQSVLSFCSYKSEIDTSLLNRYLAHTGRLVLPKMEDDNSLAIFHVSNLEKELRPGAEGILEPVAEICKKASLEEVQVILMPGLGFDSRQMRIGYGKGFYDRFLPKVPHSLAIGVGFREQLLDELPCDETDFPLNEVSLF